MERSEIFSKVQAILTDKIGIDENEVVNDANLADDFGLDSLDNVEVIMEVEKAFNILIPDEDAESIKTVDDIVNYLEKNIK